MATTREVRVSRRLLPILLSIISLTLIAGVGVAAAPAASAAQNFDQARAADIGLSELGRVGDGTSFGGSGQCIVSVQRWIRAAGGNMAGGGPVSAYRNSPADLITTGNAGVLANAVKGDVIQYTYNPSPDTYANGVHTVMVVRNNGNGTLHIVQSNVPYGSGKVTQETSWRPAPPANFTAYLWRFGQVGAQPTGNFEQVVPASNGVRVVGWALDPDTTAPIEVHVYRGGGMVASGWANVDRPDVGAAFGKGSNHGFDLFVPGAGGSVCVYAINFGGGNNPQLGCREA